MLLSITTFISIIALVVVQDIVCIKCTPNDITLATYRFFCWLDSIFQLQGLILCYNSWVILLKTPPEDHVKNQTPNSFSDSVEIPNEKMNSEQNKFNNNFNGSKKITVTDFIRSYGLNESDLIDYNEYKMYKNKQFELNVLKSKKILASIKR